MKTQKIILQFVVFVAILAAIPALLGSAWLVPKFWVLFFFVTAFTVIVIASLLAVQRIKPELYAQTFLATTIVKMLGCMAFALIFVSKIHIDKTVFLLDFAYLYFLNTAFEVYVLLCNLRNQN
ncbi:hypothetical protein D0C36_23335 [Mucilaginibacter conchicola]|uniref:ATP synthase protein I n=1 Tax=Mucilaginibacter conchicola TaxID=2303333 RepID=A0A372NNK5_9SPHI|nr:hypothetical protein [Mucilaginibacter conchicola]RFZ90177.1 hypothetical protein D0C36_23335 [Mucilaginibacter conchicola]